MHKFLSSVLTFETLEVDRKETAPSRTDKGHLIEGVAGRLPNGRQVLPTDYWRELCRAPYALIAVGTLGAYAAHPYMQAGAALATNSGLSRGGILDGLLF